MHQQPATNNIQQPLDLPHQPPKLLSGWCRLRCEHSAHTSATLPVHWHNKQEATTDYHQLGIHLHNARKKQHATTKKTVYSKTYFILVNLSWKLTNNNKNIFKNLVNFIHNVHTLLSTSSLQLHIFLKLNSFSSLFSYQNSYFSLFS